MRCLVLYGYPLIFGGESIQGELLYKGILKQGIEVYPCNYKNGMEKTYFFKKIKPEFCIGIGFWGNVPEIIREPIKHNIIPVPWFNADGWVANYQKEFDALKLMFTTSEWVKSIYKRDGTDVSKIKPMPIGIDTDLFCPSEEKKKFMRNFLGIKDDELMILTIGGDVTSKGAQEVMKALAIVDKEFKNWKYVCKSLKSKCAKEWRRKEKQLARELGILDKMIFLNDEISQEMMTDLLNSADIYAAPSRLEGFGMIQVEAMACGKPVISINKMGPAETILHNKTGFLADVAEEVVLNGEWVNQRMGFSEKKFINFDSPKTFAYRANVSQLAEYLLKLLTDKELREKMGKDAREHSAKNFDYRVVSKKMIDTISQDLGIH